MQTVTAAWLQSLEPLKNVPLDQLRWFVENSRQYELPEGAFLFQAGEPITGTHILNKGRVRMYFEQKNGLRDVGIIEPEEISGYLPFSRGLVAGAMGQVIEDAHILTFPAEKMRTLIQLHFELTQALVHVMTTRVREYTALQQQNEKMMALGKLSAGLAHELNNPAAAIVRGSVSLRKHLQLQPESFKQVIAIKMTNEQVDAVNNKLFEVLSKKEKPRLTLIERTGKEDSLNDWLDDHDVDNTTDIAENFVEFGFGAADMDAFNELIPAQDLEPVLQWINNNLVTEKMVNDIQDASQRISDLVKAVKHFTHMDRGGDKEYVDIHTGIRNTLTMLAHRLRNGNVQLVEEFDTTLPQVHAYVGELNQVWTNLIDNALDALEPVKKGVLTIRTERNGRFVKTSVIDDGPGIPEDVKSRIFDPFFTTKEIGKGTGLGLDVVLRIVKQHNGSVDVHSVPGRTAFTVCFPIDA
jgi:signal transduction histidine kinase